MQLHYAHLLKEHHANFIYIAFVFWCIDPFLNTGLYTDKGYSHSYAIGG
jgi:hypothetical protein